ncbi:hypothetical protein N7523_006514 [Penicillium sp. IBT 18751x]|nr:hypothetical protein N7523_006514 [Penicillium sp. IBT 18751x]
MARSVAVVGATGIQGGSVVRALINNEAYTVTAITRNSQSEAAKELASKGARIVEADLDDISSLKAALAGSSAAFAVTNFFEPFAMLSEEEAIEIETRRGMNLAKAAAATLTLEHFVWSTLPNAERISNGRDVIPHYIGKNRVDDYIKSVPALLQKTTFLWVTFYASNMQYPFYRPFSIPTAGENRYIQLQASPASVPIQVIGDAKINIGLFFRSIIEQPAISLPGRFVLGATDAMTTGEMLLTWASTHGIRAEFVQVDEETYYDLWPKWGEIMDKSHKYWETAKEESYSGEDVILTKEDLGITGLVDTATAFANMKI